MAFTALLKSRSDFSKRLQVIIGFRPRNEFIYELALRHSSMPHTGKFSDEPNNQRLEFLGDAVLGTICAHVLYKAYPSVNEGYLSNMRAKMVNRNTLNAIAVKMDIPSLLSVQKSGIRNANSIYGDALEALIGAVFIDRGYRICHTFVEKKIITPHIDLEELNRKVISYKSLLYEWSQKNKRRLTFKHVPQKQKHVYEVVLLVDDVQKARASGRSKKSAEENAAKKVYEATTKIRTK